MKKRNNRCKIIKIVLLFVVAYVLMNTGFIDAAGLLKPLNGDENLIKIKSHVVNVLINNGYAKTEVDQIFVNPSMTDQEAIYSFPLPKEACLSEVSLWIDGNEIKGEVLPKAKAKEIYKEQKAKGNETVLAEKNEFKTFEIYVSKVKASDETRVRLVYYQPLRIDLNVGRYHYPLAKGGVDEEQISFWAEDDEVTGTFEFNLRLKSVFPVKNVRIPGYSQDAVIRKLSSESESETDEYEVSLHYKEGTSHLSKDIIFYYRLDDTVPARVELIPYRENGKVPGHFMLVVTPGASLQRITSGTDWTFVLDVSGSMSGNKIATLSEGVSKVLGQMSQADRFRIITFNQEAKDLTNGYLIASQANVLNWLHELKNIQAGGSTNLFAGLEMACKKMDMERTTGIVLVTDGVTNVGQIKNRAFINLIKNYDLRLFTFVIGNSANQPLLEIIADASGGFAMNLSEQDDIIGRIQQAKTKVLHECMYDVELKFEGEKIFDATPETIGNIYMGQQIIVLGKYRSKGEVKIRLKAKIKGEMKEWECDAYFPEKDTDNPEIERLWALSRIREIQRLIDVKGESMDLTDKIQAIGTKYSLVTDYTSMLVIRESEMESLGIQRRNADRIFKERKADLKRNTSPVRNYQVSRQKGPNPSSRSMFHNKRSHGIGSGPFGPFLIILLLSVFLAKKREKQIDQ